MLIVGALFAAPQPETRVIVLIQVQPVAIERQSLPAARVHRNGRTYALAASKDPPDHVIATLPFPPCIKGGFVFYPQFLTFLFSIGSLKDVFGQPAFRG